MTVPTTGADTAAALDAADPLASFRDEFHLPAGRDGSPQIYLVGNSLGAVPRAAAGYVNAELERWARLGAAAHFEGELAWLPYHELLTGSLGRLVGGRPHEVVAMNSLTVNLHLLMVSFYDPTPGRHMILIEDHAFPSDHFAVESQIRQRGHDPAESLVVARPRSGEETLRRDDLLALIAEHGPELALVMLPGVQYYTGQVLPMEEITAAAHYAGARVEIITPTAPAERGCQHSLRVRVPGVDGRAVHQALEDAGVVCDWRYPDVIRAAPVPLYNSFTDIHRFVGVLDRVLDEVSG